MEVANRSGKSAYVSKSKFGVVEDLIFSTGCYH